MTFTRFTILSLIIMFISPSAGAVNLTGTWAGKFTCTGFDGEKFTFVQNNQSLKISQTNGNKVFVQWFDQGVLASNFSGFVTNRISRPDTKGHAAIADCVTKSDITTGFSEIADLNVSTIPSKGKGSLTGASIYTDKGVEVTQCKWTFKLVDTATPAIPAGCP
ncbi:MAG: hypothetical protein ACR65R_17850 [Methylomicrobium sp.]